jgi:hypothetical protein
MKKIMRIYPQAITVDIDKEAFYKTWPHMNSEGKLKIGKICCTNQ